MQQKLIYIPQFYIFLATSEEKSSEENENDIEINLNINLNGPSEKKMASGEFITSIFFLTYCFLLNQILIQMILMKFAGRSIPKPKWPAFPPKTSAKELSDSVNNRCYCRYKKSAYYCC